MTQKDSLLLKLFFCLYSSLCKNYQHELHESRSRAGAMAPTKRWTHSVTARVWTPLLKCFYYNIGLGRLKLCGLNVDLIWYLVSQRAFFNFKGALWAFYWANRLLTHIHNSNTNMLIFVVFFYVYHMHNIKLVFTIWEHAGRFATIITTLLKEAWQCVLLFNYIETVWLGQGGRQDYLYTLGWLWDDQQEGNRWRKYFSRLLGGHAKLFFPCWLPFAQFSVKMDFDKIPISSGWNVALNQTEPHRVIVPQSSWAACCRLCLLSVSLSSLCACVSVCVHGWDSSRVPASGWTHLQQSITCSRWAHQEASGWALFFGGLFNYAVSKASAL